MEYISRETCFIQWHTSKAVRHRAPQTNMPTVPSSALGCQLLHVNVPVLLISYGLIHALNICGERGVYL